MYNPSEDPADIERVFRILYTFLNLQENAQNTAQSDCAKAKHCEHTRIVYTYSEPTSIIQPIGTVSQSVSPHRASRF